MDRTFSLRKLEKSSWKASFRSGLIEIAIGLVLVVSSICHIFDDLRNYFMPLYLIPVLLFILIKKNIVIPRMGMVKFSKQRRRKSKLFHIVITAILLFLVLLTVLSATANLPEYIAPKIIITSAILLICFATAYFLDFTRLFLYGIIIAGAFNLNEFLRENPGSLPDGSYAYLMASIVFLITGGVIFFRFLKKCPSPAEGKDYDEKERRKKTADFGD